MNEARFVVRGDLSKTIENLSNAVHDGDPFAIAVAEAVLPGLKKLCDKIEKLKRDQPASLVGS